MMTLIDVRRYSYVNSMGSLGLVTTQFLRTFQTKLDCSNLATATTGELKNWSYGSPEATIPNTPYSRLVPS